MSGSRRAKALLEARPRSMHIERNDFVGNNNFNFKAIAVITSDVFYEFCFGNP